MRPQHIALAVLVVAIWGINFVVVKIGLHEIPPLLLCACRFFFATFPLIFFVKKPALMWWQLLLFSLIMYVLQFSSMFLGMYFGMTAGLTSLVLQAQIFIVTVLAMLLFKERPTLWQAVGGGISMFGIILVALHHNQTISLVGISFILAAAFYWSIGNLMVKSWSHVNTLSLVIWGCAFAWLPLLIASLIFEQPALMKLKDHLSYVSVLSIIYLAYPTTVFAFVTWAWLLRQYSIIQLALFMVLVPIFGMLSSIIVLGESLEPWKLLAITLVVSGLCLNFFSPRRQPILIAE